MERVFGLDYGTTNTVVAYTDPRGLVRPWRYKAPDGALMRSVLTFLPQNGTPEVTIGARAEELQVDSRAISFASIKRRLGEEQLLEVDVFGETRSLVDLTAIFLRKLMEPVSRNERIRAVMTIPANAPELQLQRMRLAAEAAGIDVLNWLKEPTAAAVAYGLHRSKDIKDGEIIAVVDIGGGTFDVSILEYYRAFGFRVMTTRGVEKLGGDDWDLCLARAKTREYSIQFEQQVFATDDGNWIHPQAVATLKAAAELAKIQLSGKLRAVFDAQVVINDQFVDITSEIDPTVTREVFESLTSNLINQVKDQILQALNDSDHQLVPESINHVVLVGGPTRMPAVRTMVRQLFGDPVVYDRIDPDQVVALGAARYATDLAEGKDSQVVQDVVGAKIYLVHHDNLGREMRRLLFDRNDPLGGSIELNFKARGKTAVVQLVQAASDTREVEKRIASVRFNQVSIDFGKLRAEVTMDGQVNLYVAMADGQRDTANCRRVETPSDLDLQAVRQTVDEYVGVPKAIAPARQQSSPPNRLGEISPELSALALGQSTVKHSGEGQRDHDRDRRRQEKKDKKRRQRGEDDE